MTMKFSANLGFLFLRESSNIIERIQLAGAAGFHGVEIPYPYDTPASALAAVIREAGVEQVLINSWPGDREAGDVGIAVDPKRKHEFREKLELSASYMKELNCKRLHIMAGRVADSTMTFDEVEKVYVDNISYAAERMRQDDATVLIEPINNRSVPGYWLNCPELAERIVQKVRHPNLRLQFDIFHAQIVGGDLSRRIRDWLPSIGHIQIAQVPNRDEPDSPGEINYPYVLDLLEKSGYTGWIGLEYTPRGPTADNLSWIQTFGYSLR